MKDLENLLRRIDGKGYKSYKDIKGSYDFKDYKLHILKVQGDPFASPSLLAVEIDLEKHGYSRDLYDSSSKKLAFEDYILRRVGIASRNLGSKVGSGKSGNISILKAGQEVLKRSASEISNGRLVFRFYLGLPARGRSVLAKEAKNLLFNSVAKLYSSIIKKNVNLSRLRSHIDSNVRADMIREAMVQRGFISFIGQGSILARKSSVDDRAMEGAVPFLSPSSLKVELTLKDNTIVTGMGIPKGITTITGGGFHGKSTLLNAIEKGVYNHIPGDGRELVITSYDGVKIRAEDGRSIEKTNISNFINNLPHKKDTTKFSTENASGSTSQACNIVEAIEMGADLLLIDEDTSATNFMVRDRKIQELISHEKEPITPFIEKVVALRKQLDISTIIVVGGLGDYFSVSDHVLMLDEYHVLDITKKAKEIDAKYRDSAIVIDETPVVISYKKLDNKKTPLLFNDKKCKIKGKDLDELSINRDAIDIRSLEQLVENGQVNFIGEVLKKNFTKGSIDNLKELLNNIEDELADRNICDYLKIQQGSLVFGRKYEIGAVINRIRKEIFL